MSCAAFALFLSAAWLASAQEPGPIAANQNLASAGELENGVLNVQLEIREGIWRPEADDGPFLYVQAFGEAGKSSQIPGPLLRVKEGIRLHVSVANKLDVKATVHGLNTRPGTDDDVVEIPAGESRERTFVAGAPGTYYYWARTVERTKQGFGALPQPLREDAQLNGAFIVDPARAVPPDRVFVINTMLVKPDVVQSGFEVLTINGKLYPYTEALEYTMGDDIRWRIINPGFVPHPMHLHGAFYKIVSLGSAETDSQFAAGDQESVVTENVQPSSTMMMEWSPTHVGRWLYHCHFQFHTSTDERVPSLTHSLPSRYDREEPVAHQHGDKMVMNDMAGLVLTVNVKPSATAAPAANAHAEARKLDLIIEPNAQAVANEPKFSCAIREKNKVVASEDRAVGPPIVATRGQPLEITVLNHLQLPTTIHWHGIELESYYDGVPGGGVGDQMTPMVAPGASFVARFTPPRAGTFIYHTHVADPSQLSGGIYGPLIVLEPGQSFDLAHDRTLLIGSRDNFFDAKRITVNGMEAPPPLTLDHGATYRLRIINMAPNLMATFRLGSKEHPATWSAVAKDGADLPARLAKSGNATLDIASGEAYDFEFRADQPAEIPLEIDNDFGPVNFKSSVIVR